MGDNVRILATRATATAIIPKSGGPVALVGLMLAFGLVAVAQPRDASAGPVEDALEAARIEIDAGQCDRAATRLSAIPGLEARARLAEGQCHIKAGRYPEALDALAAVRGDRDGLSPEQLGDVELYRGVALYHLERYGEARTALDAAQGLSRDEAQLSLYRGLLALRDGDNDRAAPALEAAARLAPEMTEPVASYYAGLAWQGASERGRAREAYERVIALDGDGPWGREAKKLLDSTELFPWFVRGSIGMEWDDNVLLRGNVTPIIDPLDTNSLTTAGNQDWRGIWDFEGGIELFKSDDDDWSAGATASYYGTAQVDLKDLNTHYPTIGAYLSRRLGLQTFAQARYAFGFAWVDEESYLRTHVGELSLRHTWTRAGTTVALVDVLGNDLRFEPNDVPDGTNGPGTACAPPTVGLQPCSPAGVDERTERNRDGVAYGFAVDHSYLVDVPSALDDALEALEIGGGYRFRYYDDEGSEWEHFAHILSARLQASFPLGIEAGASVSYERRDFDNRSSFPDAQVPNFEYALSNEEREEDVVSIATSLSKALTENLSLSARYSYLDNQSNRQAYDYDRHIVGGYLDFRFD